MKVKIKIYYADTDCGGVVYYARYLEYFERARTEFFESKGLSVRELAENGILFVVRSASIDYISPAKYGDIIIVDIKLQKLKGASLVFSYKISESSDEKLLVTGSTKLAAVDKTMRPARIPAEVANNIRVDL
ncbi:MAG: thioesterase family protein [Elusimicrobia bacterium]|jgi:acyl-CoA thioester hydrolase|nr:thioesterase family protein [Elusimicrobiota bacterium]